MTALLEPPITIEAVHYGPTWERNPDWDGQSSLYEFLLPAYTLGWQILDWVEKNLQSDDVDEDGLPTPFKPTREQKRFILWWYAVDERGRFVYREGVLQRLKGWGKDPLAAVLAAVEFVGPCRFAGWAAQDMPELGLEQGDPVARSNPRAWVQVAAVSKDQTKNTMKLFPGLFSKACIAEHNIDLGKEVIYAYNGLRTIEAVTSSPRALEGGRASFVIKNETHHWLENNEGHAMADVIERNATKSKDGAARTLSITNAYEPSENSVAQMERETWEAEREGLSIDTGTLYDSLEAPSDAGLRPPHKEGEPEPTEEEIKAYLSAVVLAVRGDATWLDVEGIVASILNRKNSPSRSRRFWLNQVVADEDAWAAPAAVDAAVDVLAESQRFVMSSDILRAGWIVKPDEPIVMFFDGSKSDDDTALIGCRLSDGYVFVIGHWRKPPGERGKTWIVPRHDVDNRVEEAHERFNVVAFWADPSHTHDDDGARYWDGLIDDWHRRFGTKYEKTGWATKSGHGSHSIMWDMTSPERTRQFTDAAERFITELETKNQYGEYMPQFSFDGHPALKQHMKNARRFPNGYGVSLGKGGRESPKKIDLAVAAVGARMLRRVVLNTQPADEEVGGEVWGI